MLPMGRSHSVSYTHLDVYKRQEKDSIGKRYRRQDAIGTPLCITVDYQTREDRTVTVRHRDSMEQHRVAIDELPALVNNEVSLRKLFQKII